MRARPGGAIGRGRRRGAAALLLLTALVLAEAAPVGAGVPCLLPPVSAPITDHFRAPACPYCAGNRGLEYAPVPGTPVLAAGGGSVSFAGSVAGVRYVVVDHDDGYRTTYGRLESISVRVGGRVGAGGRVGISGGELFFGLRLGEAYVDPRPLLARLAPRPHLVPLDGRHRRPSRPARLVCPGGP